MRWKKLLAWVGLGGVVVGSAFYVIKSAKRQIALEPPEEIPEGASVVVTTAEEELEILKERFLSWFEYILTPTKFKLYSIYHSRGQQIQGIPIYHVTPNWYLKQVINGKEVVNKFEQGGFYATVWVKHHDGARRYLHSRIQKGNRIEFRICTVGGSWIGTETGERILSPTVVESFSVKS